MTLCLLYIHLLKKLQFYFFIFYRQTVIENYIKQIFAIIGYKLGLNQIKNN